MALLLNANDSVSRSYSITKPSPLHPIYPSECGERTENLWSNNDATLEEWISSTGEKITGGEARYGCTFTIPFNGENSYTFKYHGVSPYSYSMIFYDSNGDFIIRTHIASPSASGDTFTVPNNTASVIAQVATNVGTVLTREMLNSYAIMLNSGSTALPYEPYGYKLPLLSGSTPVDIYLGTEPLRKIGDYVDYIDYGTGKIVRQVGKRVMTGNEVISKNSSSATNYLFYMPRSSLTGSISKTSIVCDRLQAVVEPPVAQIGINTNNNYNMVYFNFGADIMNAQPSGNTIDGCKEYLAAQYTAGTPVTIWYVFATPTEEDPPVPFPQIPTTANSTTISWAGQGLAPSQFDSIQEWVDIPTYKRVNGEWVADN